MIGYLPFSGLLFPKFRFGWKMSVDSIPLKSSSKPGLQTFLVVAEKELSAMAHHITSSLHDSFICDSRQVHI